LRRLTVNPRETEDGSGCHSAHAATARTARFLVEPCASKAMPVPRLCSASAFQQSRHVSHVTLSRVCAGQGITVVSP
jgi:hypothetical protein